MPPPPPSPLLSAMSWARPDLDPVISMRWASAGKIPVLEIVSRELQNSAAMLAAYMIIVIDNRCRESTIKHAGEKKREYRAALVRQVTHTTLIMTLEHLLKQFQQPA